MAHHKIDDRVTLLTHDGIGCNVILTVRITDAEKHTSATQVTMTCDQVFTLCEDLQRVAVRRLEHEREGAA